MSAWPMVPLGAVADFTTGSTPPTSVSDNFGGEVPWANISDLGPRTIHGTNKSLSRRGIEAGGFPAMTQPGDLMFSFKLSVGETSFAGVPMHTNEAIATFRAGQPLDLRFAYYVLPKFLLLAAQTNIYGAPLLNDSLMRRARIPFPPTSTQRRIADYLVRETGEIDAMLAKLDALAEVLDGRKLRSVAGAVKLNQNDVPNDWRATHLKYVVAERFTGEWGGEAGTDEVDVPVLRVADFNRQARTAGDDVPTIRSLPKSKAEAKLLRKGDLLLERSGGTAINPVGNVMLYTGEGGAVSSNFIECIRLTNDQEPRFWCYVQWASYATGFTHRHVRQTTGIQNLDAQMFYDETFVVPPVPEQRRIADHLDEVTGRIDAMLEKVAKLKELLIERRAALITEVVTGRKEV